MSIKPQLAADADLDKLTYPCWSQVKIDGVRAMNLQGTLTGRSLDSFKGFGITDYFSRPEFVGLDGEMIEGNDPTAERLCSLTTGAVGRFKGVTEMANFYWWVFDLVLHETVGLAYRDRYALLAAKVRELNHPRIRLLGCAEAASKADLLEIVAANAQAGYEGTIIRNPNALYKPGRPSKLNELVRVKPWADSEILVTGVTEGAKNENEAMTNSLGRTERSSAQAGKVPNGQVGSIQGKMLADYHCAVTGKLLFAKGLPITVSSGTMTVKEAVHYFENQQEIVGHIVKYAHMPFGVKDAPRFPGYLSYRLPEDMSL